MLARGDGGDAVHRRVQEQVLLHLDAGLAIHLLDATNGSLALITH